MQIFRVVSGSKCTRSKNPNCLESFKTAEICWSGHHFNQRLLTSCKKIPEIFRFASFRLFSFSAINSARMKYNRIIQFNFELEVCLKFWAHYWGPLHNSNSVKENSLDTSILHFPRAAAPGQSESHVTMSHHSVAAGSAYYIFLTSHLNLGPAMFMLAASPARATRK